MEQTAFGPFRDRNWAKQAKDNRLLGVGRPGRGGGGGIPDSLQGCRPDSLSGGLCKVGKTALVLGDTLTHFECCHHEVCLAVFYASLLWEFLYLLSKLKIQETVSK